MYGFMSQNLPYRLTYNYVWFPENSLNTQHNIIIHDLILILNSLACFIIEGNIFIYIAIYDVIINFVVHVVGLLAI